MPERTAPRQPSASQTDGAVRSRRVGVLEVGDYVGQPAAQATLAVRRAGLHPGLERSLGCDSEMVGRVVAQDPPAGEFLARESMVRLHVGAPAGVDEHARYEPVELTPDVAEAAVSVSPELGAMQSQGRSDRVFDVPPEPVPRAPLDDVVSTTSTCDEDLVSRTTEVFEGTRSVERERTPAVSWVISSVRAFAGERRRRRYTAGVLSLVLLLVFTGLFSGHGTRQLHQRASRVTPARALAGPRSRARHTGKRVTDTGKRGPLTQGLRYERARHETRATARTRPPVEAAIAGAAPVEVEQSRGGPFSP
jgi:hypothetical protein